MYSHHINNMVQEIGKVLKIYHPETIEESKELDKIKKVLEKYWSDKIAVVWTVKDIQMFAKDIGKKVSKRRACEILYIIHQKHDANRGISWETIEEYL